MPVLIAQPVACRYAVHEAVPVLAGDRELGAEPVRDGHIQRTLEISPLELTEGGFDHAAKLLGRPLGSDIDGAADGVAAKQGALGAAQDFYTLDIHHVQHAAHCAGRINTVDISADSGVRGQTEIKLPNPADKHRGAVGQSADRRGGIEYDVWSEVRQFRYVVDHAPFQGLPRECGDGDGSVLQVLLPLLRGDDDLLYLRETGRRENQNEECNTHQQ